MQNEICVKQKLVKLLVAFWDAYDMVIEIVEAMLWLLFYCFYFLFNLLSA